MNINPTTSQSHIHSISQPHLGVALLWSCTQQLDPQQGRSPGKYSWWAQCSAKFYMNQVDIWMEPDQGRQRCGRWTVKYIAILNGILMKSKWNHNWILVKLASDSHGTMIGLKWDSHEIMIGLTSDYNSISQVNLPFLHISSLSPKSCSRALLRRFLHQLLQLIQCQHWVCPVDARLRTKEPGTVGAVGGTTLVE